MKTRVFTRVSAVLLALSGAVQATDQAREIGLIQGVTYSYVKDETVWLNAGKDRFAALVRETERKQAEGGLVLLHGIDDSPDDPELMFRLRTSLPERGWTTLALFAPVRETGADAGAYMDMASEYAGRLQAAVGLLESKPLAPVALIGQRAGAAMLVKYLSQPGVHASAAVLIDLPDDAWAGLEKVRVPVLDIVAGGENRIHDDQVKQRKVLMKNNAGYQQLIIMDAAGDLGVLREMLLNRIHGWLKRGKGA